MSIASEITRLQSAKSNIRAEIINKGVNVPSTITLDQYPSYIASISGGGGTTDELFGKNICGTLFGSIDVQLPQSSMRYHALAYNPNLTDVTFKGSYLPNYFDGTFDNCYSLRTVTLSGISSGHQINLGKYAFQSCSSLISIPCPNNIYEINGSNVFNFCSYLTEVNLPNAYFGTSGVSAFSGCSRITTVNLPASSCTVLPSFVFRYCRAITTVSIPNVKSIYNYAFGACSSLTSIYMPNVQNIYMGAFTSCINLSTISFPSSLLSMSTDAFRYCSSLASVYIASDTSSVIKLAADPFLNTPLALSSYLGYFGSIYVPSAWLASYQSANRWSAYKDRMVGY